MSALEKIVRPVQTGDVFNARVLPPASAYPHVAGTPEEAKISWKGSADTDYVEDPPPYMQGFTAQWEEDRTQRVTETIKVANPNDEDQFVEIERIKETVLVNNISGEFFPIRMNWAD